MTAATPGHALNHVLITGGGGGIGAALAVAFARRGAAIGICGRDPAKLEATAALCPGRISTRACDVAHPVEMQDWLLAADDEAPVDCVVACAGVGGGEAIAGPYGEDWEAARRILEINALGVVNTIAPLLPRMVARRGGHIVIISSLAGLIALPDSPAYSASKAAVVVYGEALRRLLRPAGVAVTVVCPGFVDTPMVRSLPMRPPFMWTAERAAAVIMKGIGQRKAIIAFPWQLRCAIWTSRVLPRPVVDRILARLRAATFPTRIFSND